MEYLIVWFKIDDLWYACMCSKKNLKKDVIKIRSSETKKIVAIKKISECDSISHFKFSEEKKKFLKWSDRFELFAKYPELKDRCLCA